MRVALINFGGNVGKTVTAKNVFYPRLKDVEVFAIESINSGNEGDVIMRGDEVGMLISELLIADSAVVDVGSSNVEIFLKKLDQYSDGHEEIDLYVVPVVPESKQITDTISTIEKLAEMGISSDKIRVLFNRVPLGEDIEIAFGRLFAFYEDKALFKLNKDAVIFENEVYGALGSRSLYEVVNDTTDYKEKIKGAKSRDSKLKYADQLALQKLASKANKSLDNVFLALTT